MNKKNLFLWGMGIVAGLLLIFVLLSLLKLNPKNQSISPNILSLTQPVTYFSGKVEKISGNTLTVTQSITSTQPMLPPTANPSGPIPTPKITTVTYSVLVSDTTQISQSTSYTPYLIKTNKPETEMKTPSTLSIKNIKVGQYISVSTLEDLRTLKGNTLKATMINLPQIANYLNGKIVSVAGNALTIKAFAPSAGGPMGTADTAASAPQEKDYVITLTSATEISYMPYNAGMPTAETATPPKAKVLTVSDLKKDMQVTVYTAEDVIESSKLSALLVNPIMPIPTQAAVVTPPAETEPVDTVPTVSVTPSPAE